MSYNIYIFLGEKTTMKKCKRENISIGFLFSLFLKNQKIYFNKKLKNYNITIAYAPLLIMLSKYDDFIYQKDLVKNLYIDNALATRYLRKLEEEGFIERQEDNENRRQNKIRLTPKGHEIAKKIYQDKRIYEDKIMEDIIPKDEFIEIIFEMIENSKKLIEKQEV